jgi:XapX domain-containing protein
VGKIILGLILGLVIGIGCRCFDIPLPGPPKLIGALVLLSMTCGYLGTNYLLTRQTSKAGSVLRPVATTKGHVS